ncbi:hypothetical protein [Roseiconus lacunae]|uniref:hypothetical protein n=1 Tax=Roseiconus lacunae TaxID=2605694 RepID=UPI0011F1E08F|nr:hypothetical protein [Roseiconus lacunae]MCD0459698.1 hypothetical protein [Roseiconus lacunae]WRQ49709.1 hypothetical protein U8335_22475 [Stieleria sp. HD01]
MSTSKQATAASSNTTSSSSSQAHETANRVAEKAVEYGQDAATHYVKEPARDLLTLAKEYAKDHPDVAACWAFAAGIVVGWKLKP